MIVFTPQDYADAVNSIVDNYMYWQLIYGAVATSGVILFLLAVVLFFYISARIIRGR